MKTRNTPCKMLLAFLALFFISSNVKGNVDFCSPSCSKQVNMSLPQSGFATITEDHILSGSNNCSGDWIVTVTDENGDVVIGNVVNCLYVGQNLMVSVQEDVENGVSCWGFLLVEDKMAPSLICEDITISCNASIAPADTNEPMPTENCFGPPELTYSDNVIFHNCEDPNFDATIERTWTATDENGNSTSCTQNIFLAKALLEDVVFPPKAFIDCSDTELEPSDTGEPTVGGNAFGDYCNLKYTYKDGDPIPTCEGGYRFIREWLVLECCTNEVLEKSQVIELIDTIAPEIICPSNITESAATNACAANVILPIVSATDNCSAVTVIPSSTSGTVTELSSGAFQISNLEIGVHTVVYMATDGCGNQDTCHVLVTVEDNVKPTVICDYHNVISLDNTGCAIFQDTVADRASSDNCGIDTFFIRRMGDIDFVHEIKFDCDDVGDTILIELQVVDLSGNSLTCMSRVTVQEKLSPTLVCPSDTIIDCSQFDSLNILDLGTVTALDACGIDSVYYTDNLDGLDVCTKVGTVLRTWKAIDNNGNETETGCVQTITIEDGGGVTTFMVPPTDTISCGDTPDASDLIVNQMGCVTYSIGTLPDQEFQFDPPEVCKYKILRRWVAVNDCSNELDTFTQVFVVMDREAPILDCPVIAPRLDVSPEIFLPADCMETVTYDVGVSDECTQATIIRRTADQPVTFSDATDLSKGDGVYGIGITNVTFVAEDECGNQDSCTVEIEIRDGSVPPLAIGATNFVCFTAPDEVDLVELYANTIGFPFECTNPITTSLNTENLSQTVFTCDDFTSIMDTFFIPIEIMISDGAGNPGVNSGEVYILPTGCITGACPLFVSGRAVSASTNETIKSVEVDVTGDMEMSVASIYEGSYLVAGLSQAGNYTITPRKNNDFANGVTTSDLLKIRRHVLGLDFLDSPYQIIAADANHDGDVTTFDIVQLKNIILLNWDELPDNTSWRFIDANHQFSDLTDPFVDELPESMECVNMTESQNYMNFVGVKIGDINGNASTDDLIASDTRSGDDIVFHTEDVLLEKEGIYRIPIYANEIGQLEGFQFTLNFDADKIEFLEIEKAVLGESDFGYRFVEEGTLTCSWIKEEEELKETDVLFFVKIKAKQKETLENTIFISSEKTKALAFDENENVQGIELFFNNKKENTIEGISEFKLYQNQPNPFADKTDIRFFLPENSDVELQIIDVSGKTIKTFSDHYLLGTHTIEVKSSVFPSTGVYIYKLITPSFSASKKMTMIK